MLPEVDALSSEGLKDQEPMGVWELSEQVIPVIIGCLWLLWVPETGLFLVDGCK